MSKRKKIKIAIYITLFIIAIALLSWWFVFNIKRGRDYQRLGDMRVLESELNIYFFKFNTYIVPECSVGSVVNFCTGKEDRKIKVEEIIDPKNSDDFRYIVAEMSDDNFRIEFYLETKMFKLLPGKYALTKEGLGR